MAAKKKRAKVTDRRSSTKGKKPAAKKTALPAPFDPSDRKFVLDTFDQTEAHLRRAGRAFSADRLLAMREKFTKLPESKCTRDRCERYMQELQKLAGEIRA